MAERLAARQSENRHSATVSFTTEAARLRGDYSVEECESGLAPDELLFVVPSSLLRVLDRDLKAAGIAKRDDRGRTLDIHALRHTFGTHLSQAGVPLRTAQAAMRHSSPILTANVYTDARLLDVHGAVESLPPLRPNDSTQHDESKDLRAVGADDTTAFRFAQDSGGAVQPMSFPVSSGNLANHDSEQITESKTDEKATKKAQNPY